MYIRRRNCIILKLLLVVMVVVPVISSGVWLSHQPSTRCERHLNTPFIVLGVFLLLLSLAHLVLYNHQAADNCINFSFFVLFLVLLGYTIFALVVTTTTTTSTQGSYSKWLHNRVLDNHHWRHIRDCFIFKTKVCSPLLDNHQQLKHLSFLQIGCCTPLKECNFTYTSRDVWTHPRNDTIRKLDECDEWSNDPYVLCFNCQSCKDGFLHDIQKTWKKAAIINIIVIFSLATLWWCGDCGPDPEDDDV
ncbi:hypothetical protein BVRB_6g133480 [Beta vulgaris subsp. vulgaris]|uniref:tetraspanin-8 n=1 Tax=Beta vulgaris subsp. vulgaris TaxID=3555 RepID=UPI00053F4690|nr:tetraspanin-8 [Beta vulgaris subsp. vulgaris]KMT09248.1 hypothetical protein BVRB_6g133480 [Beta vulgaris subsp. vulgaris]